jgi:thiol-disulfide isomerase/thioredoxin
MRRVLLAVLYTALVATANAGAAEIAPEARAQLEALREGGMKKLMFHSEPQPASETAFGVPGQPEVSLADYRGKWVVLNFWATWCAPCRKEMPMLSALEDAYGGERFAVVTLATTRNSPQGIARFFDDIGVENLPRYQDPDSAVARDMSVLGLPLTVVLDPEGREVARMRGDADWDSPSARAIVEALLALPAG